MKAKQPTSVVVGSITYRVTRDDVDWLRIEHKTQAKGNYGFTENLGATIYLNPSAPEDVQRLTLWHEVLHALCESTMGGPDWAVLGDDRDEREESIILAFESPTLLVLRQNPALVAYLTT